MPKITIYQGDCLTVLKTLPSDSVHCCITSPPYWGLRDYGVDGQLGLEKTPQEYIAKMVEIFREVRRVLRADGTCWVNMGDSYYNYRPGGCFQPKQTLAKHGGAIVESTTKRNGRFDGLKEKDLCGMPWRLSLALQADGWWLRQDCIIWHKPNPMPESVSDRCTKAHEYIFHLTKSANYFYDNEAIKEPSEYPDDNRKSQSRKVHNRYPTGELYRVREGDQIYPTRNKRSVWSIASKPKPPGTDHYACFPPELPETCILAGTSEMGCCPACGAPWERIVETSYEKHGSGTVGGRGRFDPDDKSGFTGKPNMVRVDKTIDWKPDCECGRPDVQPCTVLDPFSGGGTTGLVAAKLGRNYIGIELSPKYVAMSVRRIKREVGLLAEVGVVKEVASSQ